MNTILFKGLGLEFNINPIALQFLNIKIHWYGILIGLGFIAGLLIALKYVKYEKIDVDTFLDIVLYAAPSAIIGARLYYVIFNFSEYAKAPTEIFKIWNGGLAIYGAIIGAVLAGYIYCRIKHIPMLPILDVASPGFAIAQSIGRWGNFVNQEAYGSETSLPWGMTINENGILKTVHPTFAYESLWNLIVFVVLILLYKRKKNAGEVFCLYIGLYSLGRFFIEGLRTDSLYIGTLRVSQALALVLVLLSIIMLVLSKSKGSKANR